MFCGVIARNIGRIKADKEDAQLVLKVLRMRIARTEISTDVTLAIFRIVNFLTGYVFDLLKSFFNVSGHEFRYWSLQLQLSGQSLLLLFGLFKGKPRS